MAFPLFIVFPSPPIASFAKLVSPPIAEGIAPTRNPTFCAKYAPVFSTRLSAEFLTLSHPDCNSELIPSLFFPNRKLLYLEETSLG